MAYNFDPIEISDVFRRFLCFLLATYRTIIFPVISCERKTLSLTLREECRLRVFWNRVLRRIFGPKRDKITEERKRLLNKELCAL
jgi:hypothetical protein